MGGGGHAVIKERDVVGPRPGEGGVNREGPVLVVDQSDRHIAHFSIAGSLGRYLDLPEHRFRFMLQTKKRRPHPLARSERGEMSKCANGKRTTSKYIFDKEKKLQWR